MTISKEQYELLRSPFALHNHDVRVLAENKDKQGDVSSILYVAYLDIADIEDRLSEVDYSYEWKITQCQLIGKSIECHGDLIVCGVLRSGVGGADPKGANIGENDFKAAATDAFKRASVSFGVGRYLYSSSRLFVKTIKDSRNELDYKAMSDEAWKKFSAWYNGTSPPATRPTKKRENTLSDKQDENEQPTPPPAADTMPENTTEMACSRLRILPFKGETQFQWVAMCETYGNIVSYGSEPYKAHFGEKQVEAWKADVKAHGGVDATFAPPLILTCSEETVKDGKNKGQTYWKLWSVREM